MQKFFNVATGAAVPPRCSSYASDCRHVSKCTNLVSWATRKVRLCLLTMLKANISSLFCQENGICICHGNECLGLVHLNKSTTNNSKSTQQARS